jgi:hypothetical protein
MSSKTSNISLYSSDLLSERCLHIQSVDAKLSLTSPNVFELNAPTFDLKGQTTSANDISDLGQLLANMVTLQASDSLSQSTSITTNLNSIATLDVREASDSAAVNALLGAETARATTAETVNASAIASEITRATTSETVNASAIVAEASARATAITSEETTRIAEDTNLQNQIDSLGVTDVSTLASINSMLSAYVAADNSISNLITALDTRLTTAEATIAELTQ